MTGLLAGLGTKLAERWAAVIVLPGLLFVTAVAVAVTLGHRHALDAGRLAAEVDALAARPVASSTGTVLLVAVAFLSASAGAGLLAGALAIAVEWCWHLPGGRRGTVRLTGARRARWQRADDEAGRGIARDARDRSAMLSAATLRALRRRDAVAIETPSNPSWIGDRLRATAVRLRRAYGVDLHTIWPALWLTLPDPSRAEISAARDAHTAAARAGGWAVLYLMLAFVWWPAVAATGVLALTAWSRGRRTVTALADLIEAAADCHLRDLAAQLGLPGEGPLTPADADAMMDLLGKDPDTAADDPRTVAR